MQKFLRKIFFGVVLLGNFYVCGICEVLAQNPAFILTEIHPEAEFIELQNISESEISVRGYTYSEETSSGIEKKYAFPDQNISILPGNFFVIDLSRKINNAGDVIRIYNSNQEKIAEISVPPSQKNKSYSRIDSTWKWVVPTKGSKNITDQIQEKIAPSEISEAPSPEKGLIISEIFPNPKGVDGDGEFIEIFNPTASEISLSGLFLVDASDKKFSLSSLSDEEKKLGAGSYLSLPYSQTKITINNSSEKISLLLSDNSILSQVEFSGSAPEGSSFSFFTGGYKWTSVSTPGTENIFPLSSSSSNTSLLFDKSTFIRSTKTGDMDLKIQKIFMASRPDHIDVICVKCDVPLSGIRLGVDGEVFRIPKNSDTEIFGKTGDLLRFEFQNLSAAKKRKRAVENSESEKNVLFEQADYGWKFFVPVSGLTATDETVYLGDNSGKILDAVFYSNRNGYFQNVEKEVLGEISARNEWGGTVREISGVSTVALSSQSFIKREISEDLQLQDTNSKDDFFRGFMTDAVDFSYQQSLRDSAGTDHSKTRLQFSDILFSPEIAPHPFIEGKSNKRKSPEKKTKRGSRKTEVRIKNTGENILVLSNYFLTNKEKFLSRLDENQEVLFPHQELVLSIPTKKLAQTDVFLEIRGRKDEIFDVFCFESSEKSARFRSSRYHLHLIKSPLAKNCFALSEHTSEHYALQFSRKNYEYPVDLDSYTREIPSDISEKKTSENALINKSGQKKFPKILLGEYVSSTFRSTAEAEREKIAAAKKAVPIVIARVLPNPKGKDSGNESIVLKNTASHSVWMRNFSLKTSGRKYGKKLPMIYFSPKEEKQVHFFSGFSLKNSAESLELHSKNNIIVDIVSWEKAREGEYFGAFAPRYVSQSKKKKMKKKKNPRQKKSLHAVPIPEHKQGIMPDTNKGIDIPVVSQEIPYQSFSNTQHISFSYRNFLVVFGIGSVLFLLGGLAIFLSMQKKQPIKK